MPNRAPWWHSALNLKSFIVIAIVLVLLSARSGARPVPQTPVQNEAVLQQQLREIDNHLQDSRFILLRSGAFDPVAGELPPLRLGQRTLETTSIAARANRLTASASQKPTADSYAYYIVQYSDRILPEQTGRLIEGGSEIVGYVANNAYIVRASFVTGNKLVSAQGAGEIRWAGAYGAGLKVDPLLAEVVDGASIGSSTGPAISGDDGIELSFVTFPGQKAALVADALGEVSPGGAPVIEERGDGRTWGVAFVSRQNLATVVAALASIEGVEWIEQRQLNRPRNDFGVRIIQSGVAGADTPLYRNGLTGVGQIYGAADSGLDADHAQFRLNAQASAQTFSLAVTTRNLINGLLPVTITNPDNKVLAYYVLGSGDLIDNAANPNGGKSLDPNQTRRNGSSQLYLNGVAYDDSDGGYHGTGTTSVAVGRAYQAEGSGATPGIPTRTSGDGVAPDARIVFQDVGHPSGQLAGVNTISQLLIHDQAYRSGVRVHNNSYGPDPPVSYNQDAADIDDTMWRLRDYSIFYSAGNDGSAARQISNAAKNNVVVAATSSPVNSGDPENIASYSSHGPASDGRLKPDIAAPGTVLAATENNGVSSTFGNSTSRTAQDAGVNPTDANVNRSLALTGGTSFSSPMVAGGAILVRQYFTDGFYPNGAKGTGQPFNPSNALIKAVILNSGRNMVGRYTASVGTGAASGPMPNFGQGWGRMALDDTLQFTGDRRQLKVLADIFNGTLGADAARPASNPSITTGQTHTYQVAVGSSTEPLRITLVWSDPRASVSAQVALVNNLDLEVTGPQGTVYRGNVNFANAYSQPANGAAFDNRNPVESVYIASPPVGNYSVKVIGANVPGNGSNNVIASPGNESINSNRQGYALIATANFTAGAPVANNKATSVDAASFARVAAPGQILAAFGTGFVASAQVNALAATSPLPTQLQGVQVRVNGILAPLFFVGIGGNVGAGAFQINYQLPYETAPGTAFLEVLGNGIVAASETLTVTATAPGVFTATGTGQGQAAALNQNLTPNGSNGLPPGGTPETRGKVLVLYANGQGGQLVDSGTGQAASIASGALAPSGGSLFATASPPTVTIGGVAASISFSGLAPGFAGLWQLNVVIPTNAPTGSAVPVTITAGGKQSGAVTVAVN